MADNTYAVKGVELLNSLVPEKNPYAFALSDDGKPEYPIIVLCNRNGDRINVIENVSAVNQVFDFQSVFELSFDVAEYSDGNRCTVWDEIKDFKLVYLPQYELWFEIYVTTKDDNGLTKSISATHLNEAELSEVNLYGIEINTEDDLKLQSYVPTVFYNPDDTAHSLLNRLLNKMPHYSIYHVDDSLRNLQRNFSFDAKSIMDAFDEIAEECECVFIFGEHDNGDTTITRTISAYDMLDYCKDCGERGEFDDGFCTECSSTNIVERYGNDTNVFITNENLANEVTHTVDTDSVKNCFHLEAGDDLMTATIASVNKNSSYLWFIPEETRNEMSGELQEKLVQYDADTNYYTSEHETVLDADMLTQYNQLINKYKAYTDDYNVIYELVGYAPLVEAYYETIDLNNYLQTSFMPTQSTDDTSATEQIIQVNANNISPIGLTSISKISTSSAELAIKNCIKVYVDTSKYKIEVTTSNLDGVMWSGIITLTSYTDETDTASTALAVTFNDDLERYTKQKIDKLLAKEESAPYGIVDLFDLSADYSDSLNNEDMLTITPFAAELKRYSLDYLDMIWQCAQDVMNVLIEDGAYETDSTIRDTFYKPLVQKIKAIDAEKLVREGEIELVGKMQSALSDAITEINQKLAIQSYLGDLWIEYISFRREDSYSNSNYVSDGLSNAELISQAKLFIKMATREIKKSATMQHSIETTLKNLLVLEEFQPIVYKFKLGNWLRVMIDGTVYKLRLASYTINYDSLDEISVTFTDVRTQNSVIAQVKRTFAQSKSQATSYSATSYQMVSTENVVSTTTGLLVRNYDDALSAFKDGQLRILSNGVYYTDDSWETVQSANDIVDAMKEELDEIITTAGGTYPYQEVQDDGSIIYYLMNKPILEESTMIWKVTNEAVAVGTRETLSEEFAYNAGITINGDVVARILSTTGINANWINTGAINIIDDDNNVIFQADMDNKTVILSGDQVYINSKDMTLGGAIDMAKSLKIEMSQDYCGVNTNGDGTYDDNAFTNAKTTVTVKFGNADVTKSCFFSATYTDSLKNGDNAFCEFNSNTYTLKVTGMDEKSDDGTVFLTASYNGASVTAQFVVVKIKNTVYKTVSYYQISDSNTEAPSDLTTYSTTAPTLTDEQPYLWRYERVTYTNGSVELTTPEVVGGIGLNGAKGEDGASIKTLTHLYFCGNTGQPDKPTTTTTISKKEIYNGWTTVVPSYKDGYSYYTCSKVDYDDSTTNFTDVVQNNALKNANENASTAKKATDQLGNYLQFSSDDGLIISSKDENTTFRTVVDNSSMKFQQRTSADAAYTNVASITNNELIINKATILKQLSVGNYYFKQTENGGFRIMWRDVTLTTTEDE